MAKVKGFDRVDADAAMVPCTCVPEACVCAFVISEIGMVVRVPLLPILVTELLLPILGA